MKLDAAFRFPNWYRKENNKITVVYRSGSVDFLARSSWAQRAHTKWCHLSAHNKKAKTSTSRATFNVRCDTLWSLSLSIYRCSNSPLIHYTKTPSIISPALYFEYMTHKYSQPDEHLLYCHYGNCTDAEEFVKFHWISDRLYAWKVYVVWTWPSNFVTLMRKNGDAFIEVRKASGIIFWEFYHFIYCTLWISKRVDSYHTTYPWLSLWLFRSSHVQSKNSLNKNFWNNFLKKMR